MIDATSIPLQLMAIVGAAVLVIIAQCCGCGKKNDKAEVPPTPAPAEQPDAASKKSQAPTPAAVDQMGTASKNGPPIATTTGYSTGGGGADMNIFSKMSTAGEPKPPAADLGAVSKKSAIGPTAAAADLGAVSKKSAIGPTAAAADLGAVSKKSLAPTTSAADLGATVCNSIYIKSSGDESVWMKNLFV
uniref:Uncharacterized protein n=1 Tax=Globodera rostochiensis TaxID=31243 RepID=A0A914HGE2_GLORO